MNTYDLRSLLVIVGLPVLGLAACGGDQDTSPTGGGGTTAQGGGGTGGTSTGSTSTGGTTSGGSGGTGGTTGPAGGGGTGGTTDTTGGGGTGGAGGIPTGDYDCSAAEGALPALKLTELTNDVNGPVLVRAAPGDDERLFVVEKEGTIRVLKDGAVLPEPFLDISDRVLNAGERGLLGLAFHPGYEQNGRFFVYYTDTSADPGDQVVAEFARSPNPDLAVAQGDGFGQEVQSLLTLDDPAATHNGGMLEFSPIDGFLYISIGDGGGGGDPYPPFGNGQNLAVRWGKILRIDVNDTPYSIPPGNMTVIPPNNPTTGNVVPEIWDFGLRNPWRIAFDPCKGDLYIADVGQGALEEIDVEPAGQGNKNYGWKAFEGTEEYDSDLADLMQTVVPPVAEYPHSGEDCSVSGGFVHRSAAIPGLRGRYFYADFCSGRIWSFAWDGTQTMQAVTEHTADLDNPGEISGFGQDNQGNVYVVEINGRISRIDAE